MVDGTADGAGMTREVARRFVSVLGGVMLYASTEADVEDLSRYGVSTACELRFQGACRVSSAQDGLAPQWNETLSLPFKPPRGDFTPMNLQSVTDSVVIALFDEVRCVASRLWRAQCRCWWTIVVE